MVPRANLTRIKATGRGSAKTCAMKLIGTLLGLVALSAPALGAPELVFCDDGAISVHTVDPQRAPLTCEKTRQAQAYFETCGLPAIRDLRIEIIDEQSTLAPHCLGTYVCAEHTIRLLSPGAIAERSAGSATLYDHLEPIEAFDSLLVHELAHAALDQGGYSDRLNVNTHEYVAYAMQLALMPDDVRAAFLSRYPAGPDAGLAGVNPIVLLFSPGAYTSHVWAHFSDAGNGCAFVRDLLAGDTWIQGGTAD